MARIELTRHLFSFFPMLEGKEIVVEAKTVAEAVQALDRMAPGIAFYVCDETGAARPHVNFFIENDVIRDRKRLSDPVGPASRISILQALSGG